jgi:hypothetical protein
MTSLAAVLGVLPMALSLGAAAGNRQSLGRRRGRRPSRRHFFVAVSGASAVLSSFADST